MKIIKVIFFFALILCCSCATKLNIKSIPPLVDGKLDEYLHLGVTPRIIADSVALYIYQDQHFVWLAYSYREGSFGTLDLKLLAPNITDTLNLHVSAQLGEWWLVPDAPKPDSPESEYWWNMKDWTANPVWINGMDRSGENVRYRFKNAEGRELQLSKARFGIGPWKIKMNIRSVMDEHGQFINIDYPSGKEMMLIDAY